MHIKIGTAQSDFICFQAALEVIGIENASLWWAGKELIRGKKLCDFIGRNEKTKLICKLQKVFTELHLDV
jgi:Cilia- and flagella-associated protein 298